MSEPVKIPEPVLRVVRAWRDMLVTGAVFETTPGLRDALGELSAWEHEQRANAYRFDTKEARA